MTADPTTDPAQPTADRAATGRLAGLRALVTGASQGIGVAIVDALAVNGADVVLSGRDVPRLERQAAQVSQAHGVRTAVVPADLADASSVERLATDALAAFDGLDVLVNNAGLSYPEAVVDVSVELWDAVLDVNLRAPAILSSRVGRAMAEAGRGGSIVNVASAAGLRALAEHYAYCSSKAGLIMATKVLALELGPAGVRANVVCPTVVMTEMGQRVWGEAAKAAPMLGRIPLGHFAEPSDVADAVVFLASPESKMVNGVELPLDGGFTAG